MYEVPVAPGIGIIACVCRFLVTTVSSDHWYETALAPTTENVAVEPAVTVMLAGGVEMVGCAPVSVSVAVLDTNVPPLVTMARYWRLCSTPEALVVTVTVVPVAPAMSENVVAGSGLDVCHWIVPADTAIVNDAGDPAATVVDVGCKVIGVVLAKICQAVILPMSLPVSSQTSSVQSPEML